MQTKATEHENIFISYSESFFAAQFLIGYISCFIGSICELWRIRDVFRHSPEILSEINVNVTPSIGL